MSVHPPLDAEAAARPALADPPHKPYVADSTVLPELTWSAVGLGALLGIVFGASSLYLSLKVGLTVSASIPVAVMSIALFRAFGRGKGKILENNIVQTTGSAGRVDRLRRRRDHARPDDPGLRHEGRPGHAGRGPGRPARHPDDDPAPPGVHRQAAREPAYPEGTACAKVLIVGEQGGLERRGRSSPGSAWRSSTRSLMEGLKLWEPVPGAEVPEVQGAVLSCDRVSPILLGVGYIIGPRIASVTFAGGLGSSGLPQVLDADDRQAASAKGRGRRRIGGPIFPGT